MIALLEAKHGVDVGCTYINEVKCSEFTSIIGSNLREQMLEKLRKSRYMTILINGATDSEKGEVNFRLLAVSDVENARAYGIKRSLEKVFEEAGLSDFETKMIGFMADGASVNMGEVNGLSGRLKRENDMPWLISVHCLNHRLELAVKDAFSGTYIKDGTYMLDS